MRPPNPTAKPPIADWLTLHQIKAEALVFRQTVSTGNQVFERVLIEANVQVFAQISR